MTVIALIRSRGKLEGKRIVLRHDVLNILISQFNDRIVKNRFARNCLIMIFLFVDVFCMIRKEGVEKSVAVDDSRNVGSVL